MEQLYAESTKNDYTVLFSGCHGDSYIYLKDLPDIFQDGTCIRLIPGGAYIIKSIKKLEPNPGWKQITLNQPFRGFSQTEQKICIQFLPNIPNGFK
jgi:hypothetical protein